MMSFTTPVAKHRFTQYDICAWCKKSRAYLESFPATPYCWAAPPSEVEKARARSEMDEAVVRAGKQGTFA